MQKLFLEPAAGGLDLLPAEAHRAAARSTQNQPQRQQIEAATNRSKCQQAAVTKSSKQRQMAASSGGKKLNET